MAQFTVGDARNARRVELLEIIKDCTTLLEDERVLDRPYELDAVAAALHFMQPIADNLAQKIPYVSPFDRPKFGLPIVPVAGYTGPPMVVNNKGDFALLGD